MTAPTGETPGAFGSRDATSRTLVIIAVAVLVGLFVLWKGFDDDGDASSVSASADDQTTTTTAALADTTPDAGSTDSTDPVDTTGDTEAPATTVAATTPPATNAPSSVRVFVANGTGQSGAAAGVTDKVVAQAYVTEAPGNALPTEASRIFYKPGYEADAQAIATAVGATDPAIVQAAPDPVPVDEQGAERAANANVVVILGTDGVVPL